MHHYMKYMNFMIIFLTQKNLGYIVDTSLVVLHVLNIQSWLSFVNILKFWALEILHVDTCTTVPTCTVVHVDVAVDCLTKLWNSQPLTTLQWLVIVSSWISPMEVYSGWWNHEVPHIQVVYVAKKIACTKNVFSIIIYKDHLQHFNL